MVTSNSLCRHDAVITPQSQTPRSTRPTPVDRGVEGHAAKSAESAKSAKSAARPLALVVQLVIMPPQVSQPGVRGL